MTLLLKFFLAFIFLTTVSHSTYAQKKVDYIIYGMYYGECTQHCSLMFKLNKSKVWVDTTKSFFKNWEKTATFKQDTLTHKDFLDVQEIWQRIPNLLLVSPSTTFGRPDSYDQGGIFVQLKIGIQIKTFYIDVENDKIPAELRSFADLIGQKVSTKWTYYYR